MNVLPTVAAEARALWGEGRGYYLALIAVPWGVLVGARMAYPVLLPDIQAAFGLSLTGAGLLITVLWLGGALGQFPSGVLADRYRERRILAVAVATAAVALSLIVVAPTAGVLFVGTALWGLAHSFYPIARITLLTDIYPDRIGSALGVTMATGDVGQTVLPPAVGIVAGALAWQFGLGLLVPVLAVAGVLIWVYLPDPSSVEGAVDSLSRETVRYVVESVTRPALLYMAVILLLFGLAWQSFTAFYPTYLIRVKGLSPSVAAILFGLYFGIGVVVKPLSGILYDRIGVRLSLIAALLGPVVGLLALPVVEGLLAIGAVTVLASTMLGTGAITQAYLADVFPRDMRGTGLGTVRGVVFSLASLGPVAFGGLADRGYFDEGFLILAGLTGVVILLTFRMPET